MADQLSKMTDVFFIDRKVRFLDLHGVDTNRA